MAGKPPTPQGISALLRKAGFKRSETRPGALSAPTKGYEVRSQLHGRVRVEYKAGFGRGPLIDRERNEALDKYADALTAAGYQVERDPLWPGLTVSAEED